VNHTLISFVSKVNNPETPMQFQRINLYNTLHKILAKILVNRMWPILQRIIHPTQNVFVPDRTIHENILIVREIINKFRYSKRKKAYVALKLDMKKAYDRIE